MAISSNVIFLSNINNVAFLRSRAGDSVTLNVGDVNKQIPPRWTSKNSFENSTQQKMAIYWNVIFPVLWLYSSRAVDSATLNVEDVKQIPRRWASQLKIIQLREQHSTKTAISWNVIFPLWSIFMVQGWRKTVKQIPRCWASKIKQLQVHHSTKNVYFFKWY